MEVGQIIHAYSLLASKPKFQVVVCTDPKTLLLFINSEITKFHRGKPHLEECYVPILKSDHGFLDYNSYIYCAEAHSIQSVADPIENRGTLTDDDMARVCAAVGLSRLMLRGDKRLIIESL